MSTIEKFFKNATDFNQYGEKIVYATPGTENHSDNLYGDGYVCELTEEEVEEACAIMAVSYGWTAELTWGWLREELQYDRPSEER